MFPLKNIEETKEYIQNKYIINYTQNITMTMLFCRFFLTNEIWTALYRDLILPPPFIKALDEYVEYYNRKRIKVQLKGKSSVQYWTLSIYNWVMFNLSNFSGALQNETVL